MSNDKRLRELEHKVKGSGEEPFILIIGKYGERSPTDAEVDEWIAAHGETYVLRWDGHTFAEA